MTAYKGLAILLWGLGLAAPLWGQGAGQPAPTPEKVAADLAWMINTERAKAGVSQLAEDSRLDEVARKHCEEMRDLDYFAHESPVVANRLPSDRYRQEFGTDAAVLAENIEKNDRIGLTLTTAQTIEMGFLQSPEHKANMLQDGVTVMGVGLAVNADGTIWATEMFAKPREGSAAPATAPGAPGNGAPGASAPSGGGAAAALVGGAAPAAGVVIFYLRLDADGHRTLTLPLRRGDFIRVGITPAQGLAPRVVLGHPGGGGGFELPARPLADAYPVAVGSSGAHRFDLSGKPDATCRFILVSGSETAVFQYGRREHGSAPLDWDRPLEGSLGDAGCPDSFGFKVAEAAPAELVVRALAGRLPATLSVYGPDQGEVARATCARDAHETRLPLGTLAPGRYTVVLLDLSAAPGADDYEITLRKPAR